MSFKLVLFVIALILITVFAGFNLDNKCNISFVFKTVNDVPVFLSLMVSFLLGMIVLLPFTISKRSKSYSSQYEEKESKKKVTKKSFSDKNKDNFDDVPPVVESTPENPINDSSSNDSNKKTSFFHGIKK